MQEPEIIFENADFVAVNKPAGLLVHRVRVSAKKKLDAARADEPTLAGWLAERYPSMASVGDDPEYRPGIVHRLDKETSGVMVAAKTQAAFEELKALFQSHAMRKTYEALVFGVPQERHGVIDRPIGIRNGTLKRSVHVDTMAKPAITEYRVLRAFGSEYALVEAMPKTGRTHQIRVHLASIGHPLVGDALYRHKHVSRERERGIAAPRLMLHARSLEFADRAGHRFAFEAPLPPDFLAVIHSIAH